MTADLQHVRRAAATGNEMSGRIEVHGVSKWFATKGGEHVHALDSIGFTVEPGEFVSIIGPSGCGKSTLLRIVHGLVGAEAGEVLVGGKPVTGPSPSGAMVFQSVNLYPWRTTRRNVEFGLEMRGVGRDERRATADRLLEMIGLQSFADAYPSQLSGGMQQRVGLARALAVDPTLLYMDEPFGALDAQTKVVLQGELALIVEQFKKTVLFVTHDMEEAVFLSDRVLVMSNRPGQILEDITVDLPRPRADDVRRSPEFVRLKDHVWELLRGEQHAE
ncbi:MAG: transporter related protein [Solirubrobacterales bacterium]|nr:transporter related protein [Solirubrobacterales bacterium]